jgi:cation diffusion facilitator family transporter
MQWLREYKPQPDHERAYRVAMVITIGGNLMLAVGKGITAWISGSAAVYSDAANSASDVVYSLLMMVGLWMALKPPDLGHQQGHSRFEPLVGLIVTLSMGFAGFEAARNALQRYSSGNLSSIVLGLPSYVLLASALVKGGMFLSISRISKQVRSPALATTARDNLSDVLTSAAAFIGVLGSNYIHPLADPIAGIVVSAWIFRQAFLAGKENLGFLTGKSATQEELKEFIAAAESIPGVLRVHHIMTEYAGPRLVIDLHVNVNGNTPLKEAHEIADKVIQKLESFSGVDRAYVHIEPHDWVD